MGMKVSVWDCNALVEVWALWGVLEALSCDHLREGLVLEEVPLWTTLRNDVGEERDPDTNTPPQGPGSGLPSGGWGGNM